MDIYMLFLSISGGPQQAPVPQGYNNQQGGYNQQSWNAYNQWQQPQVCFNHI